MVIYNHKGGDNIRKKLYEDFTIKEKGILTEILNPIPIPENATLSFSFSICLPIITYIKPNKINTVSMPIHKPPF